MPPFSAAPQRVGTQLSTQLIDFRGKPKSATIAISAAATEAQADAITAATGNISNARVMEQRITNFTVQVSNSNPLNTAFDEAYATVDDELVLLFQADATGEIREYRVPAPDAIVFATDGETMVTPDGAATAGSGAELLDNLITALLAGLGAGFTFSRGYKNNTGRRVRQPLPLAEPTGNPGDEPGV